MYITEVDCKMNDIKAPILTVLWLSFKTNNNGRTTLVKKSRRLHRGKRKI